MKPPATIKQVVNRFRRRSPDRAEGALINCGVALQYIKSGCYRDVYRIVGFPLAAKFLVKDGDDVNNLKHANEEMRTITRMRGKRYKDIHRYLPEVYFFNSKTGTMLMREYKPLRRYTNAVIEVGDKIGHLMGDVDWDYHKDNFGTDSHGNIVALDLGYFNHLEGLIT